MGKMKPLLLGLLAASVWAQVPSDVVRQSHQYAGKWWANADSEERAGFINGAGDCLTWAAHIKGFSDPPEQIAGKIDGYYKSHSESADLSVVEVWEKVSANPGGTPGSKSDGGERWTNVHWYLNGDWWGQIGHSGEVGYLTGYIWCVNNRVQPRTDAYSRPINYYQERIEAYIDANPRAGNEAVADILHRLRDKNVQGGTH
jgi:hypothetical protein